MFPPPSDLNAALPQAILIIAIIVNGLLAGVFFAFSCAIVPGFRRLDDGAYVRGFRAINTAILNGWFLFVFLAAPVAATAGAIAGLVIPGDTASAPVILGAGLSILTFAITAALNVPLNRGLDAAAVDTAEERRAARTRFEVRWNRGNLLRTITSLSALICLSVAAFT